MSDGLDWADLRSDVDPPMYLMTTIDPDIAMVALENYIVATNSSEQRGRAIRALADFMARGGSATREPRPRGPI